MEQQLIESLIVESIKIYGHDVYYLPRRIVARDDIYGEDPVSKYDQSYMIEMYIKNVEGFEGDGDFLSKFNLEIRDRITFTVAMKTFSDEVGAYEAMVRPNEGDLIYLPLNEKVFQIKFVEHEAIFYQLGSLQTFDLTCELFEYSNEILSTSIGIIDDMQTSYSTGILETAVTEDGIYDLLDERGYRLVNEGFDLEEIDPSSDNAELELEGDSFIDFSEIDPFSEGKI